MKQQDAEQAVADAADFQCLHEIVAEARRKLHQNDWDYIVGARRPRRRPRQDHRRLFCAWHRYRRGDCRRHPACRSRPHAMVCAGSRRRTGACAYARIDRARSDALPSIARSNQALRPRSLIAMSGGADESAARTERVSAAQDRGLRVLIAASRWFPSECSAGPDGLGGGRWKLGERVVVGRRRQKFVPPTSEPVV